MPRRLRVIDCVEESRSVSPLAIEIALIDSKSSHTADHERTRHRSSQSSHKAAQSMCVQGSPVQDQVLPPKDKSKPKGPPTLGAPASRETPTKPNATAYSPDTPDTQVLQSRDPLIGK